jgi:glycolate oxidase iron-sulfur subunit
MTTKMPETIPAPVPETAPVGPARVGSTIDYEKFLDCVHCGLCTAACPTYLETGDENNSPRGRIYLMRSIVDGRLGLTAKVEKHLDLCLDCRSCETACPSGVQYGRLIEPFRANQRAAGAAAGAAKNDDWFHRLVLYGLFPYPRRMRWALGPARLLQKLGIDRLLEKSGLTGILPRRLQRMQRLLPRLVPGGPPLPEFLPAVGPKRARVALFTGCVADALFRHTHWATARVLAQNGCDVVVPRGQACCGAIHYHSGADEPAMQLAQMNAAAFDAANVDAVIVNVAGCGSMLKDYGDIARELGSEDHELHDRLGGCAAKMKDVNAFLGELGIVRPTGEIKLRVVYQDACHLVHAQRVRDQPRELLAQIPGLEIIPIAEPEICCGAAGSYNLTEPEMSDCLAQRKLQNILAASPQAVITGNVGCSMQIQAALRQARRNIWVAHPVELLDLSYRRLQPPPGARQ